MRTILISGKDKTSKVMIASLGTMFPDVSISYVRSWWQIRPLYEARIQEPSDQLVAWLTELVKEFKENNSSDLQLAVL